MYYFKSSSKLFTHLFELNDILYEEPVGVVPRQEDVLEHIFNSFLLETQVVSSDHRRVDEVQTNNKHISNNNITAKAFITLKEVIIA